MTDDSFTGDSNKIMAGITTLEDGRIVAVGNDVANRVTSPSVWTSSDGLSWQQIDEFESVDEGSGIAAVAVWDEGLVAVGHDESGDEWDAAIWV